MVVIIDYNIGNPLSIKNMLSKIGVPSKVSGVPEDIDAASKLILPGVGHFSSGMENLAKSGLIPVIERNVFQNEKPILGICLGMQMMTKRSEESTTAGLGWVDAETVRFTFSDNRLKVPHMGWNQVEFHKPELASNFSEMPKFYFVHSYYVRCNQPSDVLAATVYGSIFHSGFAHRNIYGVQFHPEKSHKYGMNLLRNFSALNYTP